MSLLYRSQPLQYASGALLTVPTNFLDAARKLSAPVIEKLLIRINFAVTTGTSGSPLARLAEIFTAVKVQDQAGDRVNLRGTSLYRTNQIEHGLGYSDGADLAASGSPTGSFFMEVPLTPRKARRRNDYGMPLLEFLDGGQMSMQLSASASLGAAQEITAITGASTSFEVYALIREERRRELKSRVCWMDYDVTVSEYTYPINGSLRWFEYFVGEVAWHGGTTHVAQNITSRTVDLTLIPDVVLRKLYALESHPQTGDGLGLKTAATVRNMDLAVAGYSIPAVFPRLDEKIVTEYDCTGFHFRTDAAITTGNIPKMIYSVITDRQAALSAKTLGAPSQEKLAAAIAKYGRVKTALGGTSDTLATSWAQNVVKRLPITLKARAGS